MTRRKSDPPFTFISYVSEDYDQVSRISEELEQYGVRVWIDRNSIAPGDNWKNAIQDAIGHGSYFLACFSESYFKRIVTVLNSELRFAIHQLRLRRQDRSWFIPVLLSDVEIPRFDISENEQLSDIQGVPLHADWHKGIEAIVSVIKPLGSETRDSHLLMARDSTQKRLLSLIKLRSSKDFNGEYETAKNHSR